VHEADSAEAVYRDAREGDFPADKVTTVEAVISPVTAREAAAQ
jgi:hypothetical protein